ncbi:MAG: UDP-N-acetylmuramoyl-L-alanine--D-glutamate ligase [Gammaproteobacteria bacterium]|nr:UDP-N-acetylmuramoyl-L-alanine--D-glutamate ligase [Gammaproteobacteria bacterium]
MMTAAPGQNAASVIVGLGDSGFSCARHFRRRGRGFRVVDSRPRPPRLAELRELDPAIEVELGGFRPGSLLGAGELVVSPGVDLREPALAEAVAAGVPVTGDIDLFSRAARGPIVAVTGSNGKSTVVAMLAAILDTAGVDYGLGGNLDGERFRPALDLLEQGKKDWYVLEVSSFQLETTRRLNAEVALILNLSADHMDRYDSLKEYASAKRRIFRGCRRIVLNRDDPFSAPPHPSAAPVISYGLDAPAPGQAGLLRVDGENWLAHGDEPFMPAGELKPPGQHNVSNALAALALALAMGVEKEAIGAGLKAFPGLPHRCQWLGQIAGVDWYNDSKATNVGACAAAVGNLGASLNAGRKESSGAGGGRVLLIAGGLAKGADFSPLAPVMEQWGRAAILIGRDARRIASALGAAVPVHFAASLGEAVALARGGALPGDAVALSPACASFDQFDSFQARGDAFIRCVEALR